MQLRCTSPKTVGFKADGKTLCWSPKDYSKEYATFQIPCGKCISCRLENARQTAVRCVHEASMYENNCFVTLTYSEEKLKSPKLQYQDVQAFVKALRTRRFDDLLKTMFPTLEGQKARRRAFNQLPEVSRKDYYEKIKTGVYIAGEYGDKKKRPHWHLLIFNYSFQDSEYYRSNALGDRIFTSKTLEELWPHNDSDERPNEIGEITFKSAGYCARYASKKLAHGKDGTHDYEPISRRSSKHAIGKAWIEKNWKDCFTTGVLVFKDGDDYIQCGIPRYYEKWLKKHQPKEWEKYVTQVKPKIIKKAVEKEEKITLEEKKAIFKRQAYHGYQTSAKSREIILKQKFKKLSESTKL